MSCFFLRLHKLNNLCCFCRRIIESICGKEISKQRMRYPPEDVKLIESVRSRQKQKPGDFYVYNISVTTQVCPDYVFIQ